MGMKAVRKQLSALRAELNLRGGREWITISVPERMPDDNISAWLAHEVGPDWKRHLVVRLDDADAEVPRLIGRSPVADDVGISSLRLPESDAALL